MSLAGRTVLMSGGRGIGLAIAVVGDVRDERSVEDAVEKAVSPYGGTGDLEHDVFIDPPTPSRPTEETPC